MSRSADPAHDRRWLVLAVLGLAQLVVVLDATIVNIALPSAQADLGFSDGSRQWIVTAYALAFGSLLLVGGRLGDLFGRRRMLVVGLGGFALASAVGGLADGFTVLVTARALQGVFGALLAPAALSLLTTTFTDVRERGRAFGIFGAIAGSGAAVGLLLGGVLTEAFDWRSTMFVNLLLAVPAMLGAVALIPESRPEERPRLDIPGTLAVVSGLFALVYGLGNAATDGWSDPVTVVALAVSVPLLAAFVARQARAAHPLLPLRVLADRNRGGSYLAIGIAGAGMFGVFLFLTYYLQGTLGYSPIRSGAAFLPLALTVTVVAALAGSLLVPRFGGRPLVPTGMTLAAVAMVLLTRLGLDATYVTDILPSLVIAGTGFGLVFAPSMSSATAGVEPHDAGVASAMVNTSQQVGGSIGTALLSTVAASSTTAFLAGRTPTAEITAQAVVHGYAAAFWLSAAFFAVGAIVTALLLRPGVEAQTVGEPVLVH